jgi:hypothetical protein
LVTEGELYVYDDAPGPDPGAPRVVHGLVEHHMGKLAQKPNLRSDVEVHPSSAVDVCYRQLAIMRRFGIEAPWVSAAAEDHQLQRMFDVGHALHRLYQETYFASDPRFIGWWSCSRCGFAVFGPRPAGRCTECVAAESPPRIWQGCLALCGDGGRVSQEKTQTQGGCLHCGRWGRWEYGEIEVDDAELRIRGKVDGILVEGGEWTTLIDIKTANSFMFSNIRDRGAVPDKYIVQLQMYLYCLRKRYPEAKNLSKGILFFVNKNLCEEFEVEYDFDPDMIAPYIAKAQAAAVESEESTDELPERTKCRNKKDAKRVGCPPECAAICFA